MESIMKKFYNKKLKPASLFLKNKTKTIATKQGQHQRLWADLPLEILSLIAQLTGPFDITSFALVCHTWHNASSSHIIKHERNKSPWFLLYNDRNPECKLLTTTGKTFTTFLPQLKNTSCLATHGAWLLLFKTGGNIFLFHVFSRQRIDLAKFPSPKISDHIGAVSSCPSNPKECIVCVVRRADDVTLEAMLLFLGGKNMTWISSQFSHPRTTTDTIKSAVFLNGQFSFFGGVHDMGMVTLMVIDESPNCIWEYKRLVVFTNDENRGGTFSRTDVIRREGNELKTNLEEMKMKLGLMKKGATVSTCGTMMPIVEEGLTKIVYNERVTDDNNGVKSKHRSFKGVWIQPRSS